MCHLSNSMKIYKIHKFLKLTIKTIFPNSNLACVYSELNYKLACSDTHLFSIRNLCKLRFFGKLVALMLLMLIY